MTVRTGRVAPEAVMVVAEEDFASLWSVFIFPLLNLTVFQIDLYPRFTINWTFICLDVSANYG